MNNVSEQSLRGGATRIARNAHNFRNVALDTNIANNAPIQFGGASIGVIVTNGAPNSAKLYACSTKDGNFVEIYDSDGIAATVALAANKAINLPSAIYPFSWIKIEPDVACTVDIAIKG